MLFIHISNVCVCVCVTHFISCLLDKPSVKVMGSLAFGVFDGTVRDGNEVYYIEPSNR